MRDICLVRNSLAASVLRKIMFFSTFCVSDFSSSSSSSSLWWSFRSFELTLLSSFLLLVEVV
jgi:hypothetical protein